MSAHWEELERIFAEARQLPAGSLDEFLASSCGANAALRADAESLLSASTVSRDFLERPAIERLAKSFATDGLDLKPGRRIGAYTIVHRLGAGGAGDVWRAKDERLGRDVAVKFVLPHLAMDAERLRRFAEEARAAGTLNHPNIVTVHDVGEHDGMPYLVSECLEGRNLRERLKSAPLPVAEAVAVVQGVAHGLAAAHERGIVHRDLKPENTFLKADGGVKLLDFGLAKLKLPDGHAKPGEDDTALSLVAGTAAYMAPEQVRGEAPDPRADLFALGVMMYEMLAGQHPFRGASVLETLHAILTRDPPDLHSVNARVPPGLARIVMRLLQKAPEARFQSARDLAWSLAQATDDTLQPTAKRPHWLRFVVPASAAVFLAAGWWLAGRYSRSPASGELTRFAWALPAGTSLESAPLVAPDGRRIAYTALDASRVQLFVRPLASVEAQAVAGTDDAMHPFWSPDGKALGFFQNGKLLKVTFPGGAPTELAEAPQGWGGAWTKSGTVVFAPDLIRAGLNRVSAEGGETRPATLLDRSRGETGHLWPVALPDGVHFLYFVKSVRGDRRGIYLGRLDRPAARAEEPLFYSDSGVALLPRAGGDEAELVYLANGRVEARRFNNARLSAAADARTIGFLPAEFSLRTAIMVTASEDVMAFADSTLPSSNRLASIAPDGTGLRLWDWADAHGWPRVSPDGKLIARGHMDETRSQPDIWVEDLERGTAYPVLRNLDPDMGPVWSPDGRQLAFVTGHLPYRKGELALNIVAADGTGIVRSLTCPGDYCEPTDWSRDGSTLLLNVMDGDKTSVWTISTEGAGGAKPLLADEYVQEDARYSPDGRWVAYVSYEAGHAEVLVHSAGGPARRLVVSGEGGAQPVWRRDGKVLYFVDLKGQLQSVAVNWSASGEPVFGLPAKGDLPQVGFGHWGTQFDVSPDGGRIYFMQPTDKPPPREIQVAINWRALLD